MKDLINKINEFVNERDWGQFHSPKNLSMALGIEVAELQEHFQWLTQDESRNPNQAALEQIKEEIGDVFIYLIRLCTVLEIDIIEAADSKMEINSKKYPVEKAKGNALKSHLL